MIFKCSCGLGYDLESAKSRCWSSHDHPTQSPKAKTAKEWADWAWSKSPPEQMGAIIEISVVEQTLQLAIDQARADAFEEMAALCETKVIVNTTGKKLATEIRALKDRGGE